MINGTLFLSTESAQDKWPGGTPNEEVLAKLNNVHEVIHKVLDLIPM